MTYLQRRREISEVTPNRKIKQLYSQHYGGVWKHFSSLIINFGSHDILTLNINKNVNAALYFTAKLYFY